MVDWDKPVQTRGGRKVRVLCTDLFTDNPNLLHRCVIAAVEKDCPTREVVFSYLKTGRWLGRGGEHDLDLVNPVETKTLKRWMTIYHDGAVSVSPHYPKYTGKHSQIWGVKEIEAVIKEGEGL